MANYVVDASVILKWLLGDREEADQAKAVELLTGWAEGRNELWAPALWEYEVANFLGREFPDEAERRMNDKYEVKFRFIPDGKIEEQFVQTQGKEFPLLLNHNDHPGLNFFEKYDIRPGKVLDCTLKVIVKGTCPPMLFDFPFITPED